MPGFPEPPLPAAVLADLRGVMDATLTDTATVARTGEVIDCYLEPKSKDFAIERGLRLHSYDFFCDWQKDVQPGDLVTVGALSYAIQGTSNPRSQSVELDLVAIPTSLMLAAILAPEQAVFRNRDDVTKKVNASVYVMDRLEDIRVYGDMPAYPWTVVYESTVTYPGGGRIGDGHHLLLASLFGTDGTNPRHGTISKPRPILHGLPFSAVYVKEL